MSPTDANLFENWLRKRDADAFKVLAGRYAAMVYQTCCRILNNPSEAEDVTQECFVILAATRKPVGGYLAPWLHRVAYNRSIARLRSEHRRKDRELRFASEQQATHDRPWDEVGGLVDEAIAELPEKLRIPVVACFLDGKTHEAAAQTLGIPRSTVTYRVDRGVECLRKSLKGKGVAVTAAALTAAMTADSAVAMPSAVLANLGKLALSGAGHVTLPAAAAAGVWSAKTLVAAAAGVAVLLFAGWEFNRAPHRAEPHAVEAQRIQQPAPANAPSETPAAAPAKRPEAAENAVPETLTRRDLNRISASGPTQDRQPAPIRDATPDLARGGLSLLSDVGNSVAYTWGNIRRTLNGENQRRTACQTDLKQLGLTFKMFANDAPGNYWPALDPRAGHLMFANENPGMKPVFPTYLGDTRALICQDDTMNAPLLKTGGPQLLENGSYFYLGYAVHSIEELEMFAEAYRDHMSKGLAMENDIETPRGTLYRLREGVERFFITDWNNPAASAKLQSEILVLIEAPHHDPEGGNILCMDGHVEFRRYAAQAQFPMNKEAMDLLLSLSAMRHNVAAP